MKKRLGQSENPNRFYRDGQRKGKKEGVDHPGENCVPTRNPEMTDTLHKAFEVCQATPLLSNYIFICLPDQINGIQIFAPYADLKCYVRLSLLLTGGGFRKTFLTNNYVNRMALTKKFGNQVKNENSNIKLDG